VLITGANRGIGLEFARQYREAGWQVIGTARKPDAATDLQELGARVLQLDVTDADSVARLAADLEGQPIDLLVNNAGILIPQDSLAETNIETAARMLDVNILGPIRVTQALLPNLSAGSGKTVVNISSGLGSVANNDSARFYGYRESKAALNMFSRSLGAEKRDEGFIVVAMDPGWVQTDMGGPNATLTVEQSVSGMRKVIGSLTMADTGTYRSHGGSVVPW
jgi:NAD(P)-dependent dehydrogenase (short-subunit alcohol dehydrogenase family)